MILPAPGLSPPSPAQLNRWLAHLIAATGDLRLACQPVSEGPADDTGPDGPGAGGASC